MLVKGWSLAVSMFTNEGPGIAGGHGKPIGTLHCPSSPVTLHSYQDG